jgi:hypothetical protein
VVASALAGHSGGRVPKSNIMPMMKMPANIMMISGVTCASWNMVWLEERRMVTSTVAGHSAVRVAKSMIVPRIRMPKIMISGLTCASCNIVGKRGHRTCDYIVSRRG